MSDEVTIEFECRDDDHSVTMSVDDAFEAISTIVCEYDGQLPTVETYMKLLMNYMLK